MKVCIRCEEEKDLSEFYKHNRMADGHLNVCKSCVKSRVKKRTDKLMEDPTEVEKERARGREKYSRLDYAGKSREYSFRFPEKKKAHGLSSHIFKKGYEKHHWSYHAEDAKSVVFLSPKDHKKLHRNTRYDQEQMMYRDSDGYLLDSVDRVECELSSILITDYEWHNK